MGVFDYIDVPDHGHAQVKMLDRTLTSYTVGDLVPESSIGLHTYSIKLLEFPLWMNVFHNRIIDFTEEPTSTDRFDKWGRPYEEERASPLVEELREIYPDRSI